LQDNQQEVIASIRSKMSTVDIQVIRINTDALLSNRLAFNLDREGTTRFEAERTERTERPGNIVRWKGKTKDEPDPVQFLIKRKEDTNLGNGTFIRGKFLYELRPLGDKGLHTLIKIDPNKFAKDEPDEFKDVEQKALQSPPHTPDPMADEPADGYIIKVMV